MAIYDGIEDVSGGSRLPALYENEGNYKLELLGVPEERTSKKTGLPMWSVTLKVKEYSGPADVKVGDTMVFISRKQPNGFNFHIKDLKNFLASVLHAPESRITNAVSAECFNPENKEMAGTEVLATVAPKENSTFLNTKFYPASESPIRTYDREAETIASGKATKTPPPAKARGGKGAAATV